VSRAAIWSIIHLNIHPAQGGIVVSFISMILGLLSIFVWPLPYLGFPTSIAGLALGILGLKRHKEGTAVAGTVMSSLGLALTIVNLAFGLLDLILKTYFQY
jgi:hypothetical protein